MRVLVTGGSGMLGSEVLRALAGRGIAGVALDRAEFLQSDVNAQFSIVKDFDVVIHAAANTNVEACELAPEECYRDNCFFTERLFHCARRCDVKFVFISSTGVYGRSKITPYHEYDSVSPTTIHHHSKRMAEQTVLACADTLVARVGWLFGGDLNNKKNFVANRLKEIGSASGFIHANAGQIGSPTYVYDCAQVLLDLIVEDCSGIYNVVNDQSASRFDYVKQIVELAGASIEVRPAEPSSFKRHADVPENEAAISYRMRFEGRPRLRPWQDALAEYMCERGLSGLFE